nr:putative RNA-directed DNA polymerase, eukaryota, reverse transcriptase zinc-binding domain protein [Tanacetum cinerariifolium]
SSDVDSMHVEGDRNVNVEEVRANSVGVVNDGSSGNRFNRNSKEDSVESVVSGHFKKSTIPRTRGSILGILDEMVKVGQVMGYNMDGCLAQKAKKDWVKELCIKYKVNFLALQETKMESMNLLCLRTCWGNLAFEYAQIDSVGNSGVRGVWRSTGQLVLLITIYAPRDVSEKQMLWDFLQCEISKWTGDVVIMGDFNEVRYKSDRFGSVYNAHGASLFDSFIRSSGLVEVNLGFSKVVEDGWKESPCDRSNAMRNLLGKLKHLKKVIRVWNKTNTINVNNIKAQHKIALEDVDSCIDKGNGTEEDVKRRVEILNKIQDIDKLKSLEMAQKAKVKWAVEGDENYSFFHGVLNKKRNLLNIQGVMANGVWVDNPNKVKSEFCEHFSKRFCKPGSRSATLQMRFPKCITLYQQRDMECEVTNDEIKKAVWDCGLRAQMVLRLVSIEGSGCNSSFIALIPKIPDANMVKDFRHISLVGSLYKIIAKILANRLVGVLGDIVSEVQSAFIADRQILDGMFILNEVLQWCKVKKKQALIFKVDFEKVYDSVRWDFLDKVLSKFGFGEKWCKWIQACLKSSRGSIIINGSPTKEFQFGKGLKQGDPLSPFLFILIMKSLHLSFQRVVDAAMFHGLQLGGLVNLSHMFYADDAVFVGQWSESNINSLVHVLECFNLVSGLKINMRKSKIMGVHVNRDKVNRAAMKLGCLVLKAPFLYLGSMVGGVMSKANAWILRLWIGSRIAYLRER